MNWNKFHFYQNRVAVNFLARDPKNAKEVYDAMDGNAIIGLLSSQFDTTEAAIEMGKAYLKEIPVLSIGLGNGDPKQWHAVAEIASSLDSGHANQVFPAAGYTKGMLDARKCNSTFVNALVRPTGTPGIVEISTGPNSQDQEKALVAVETAIAMLKEVGVSSVKFFHMKGLTHLEELKVVAEASAKLGMPVIEPTGGITPENVAEIVKVCLDAGVERIVPHIYGSVIDKNTGKTNTDLVKKAYQEIQNLF